MPKFDVDTWNPMAVQRLPTVRELVARRNDADTDHHERTQIDLLAAMCRAIKRADGIDVLDKSMYFVSEYYRCAYADGRIARADDEIDPQDLANRSAGGENANAGAYGSQAAAKGMPEITTAQQWKAAASALGAYPDELRGRVRGALLASADLVGADVLDVFQRAWDAADLNDGMRGDDAGAAHVDDDDADDMRAMQRRSSTAARQQLATPSRAKKVRS